ncbi:Uncharacterised protein [Mycobacterium tuberculosis]|nr:Uncharacterised protein [Mycobacterium tuberculosis]COX54520.1 Uncharacterised protein [Mycobacterium tuberculosis]
MVDTCITLRLLEIRTYPASVIGVVAHPFEENCVNHRCAAAW